MKNLLKRGLNELKEREKEIKEKLKNIKRLGEFNYSVENIINFANILRKSDS